ncbi:MAG: hypothetical protein PHN49_04435 [Candidatus Omnitrophica bacterium]|nr:hypothetical protein [Candidatus Omnitrophota bacterium]MDD5670870.1 hypothetical protein [Candidatus Omnitrophota bacterium]
MKKVYRLLGVLFLAGLVIQTAVFAKTDNKEMVSPEATKKAIQQATGGAKVQTPSQLPPTSAIRVPKQIPAQMPVAVPPMVQKPVVAQQVPAVQPVQAPEIPKPVPVMPKVDTTKRM